MRVAYLFIEKYPNFDLDFQVFSNLMPEELATLRTDIKTGQWGFFLKPQENWKLSLSNIFCTGEGNIFEIQDQDKLFSAIQYSKAIYTVQIHSITKQQAFILHSRLKGVQEYIGFVQVLPQVKLHKVVFGELNLRYQIEAAKVYVLFSQFLGNEEFADEIIARVKEKNKGLDTIHIVRGLCKRDTGLKGSILDSSESDDVIAGIDDIIHILNDAWLSHLEQTIYRLQDAVPDALTEFITAIKILKRPVLSSEDCAQISVSLRRTIEKVTDVYCEPSDKNQGWVIRAWKKFSEDNFEGKYSHNFSAEIIGAIDFLERLSTTYQMTNKAVHNDNDPIIFKGVILRMIPLLNDLLRLKSKHTVKIDPRNLFENFDD
jgi:hypothetical protein